MSREKQKSIISITIIIAIIIVVAVFFTVGKPVKPPVNTPSRPPVASVSSLPGTPQKSPDEPTAPRPTGGWVKPPEKHYDENNFIAKCREKYITGEIEKTGNLQWDLKKEEEAIRRALKKHPGNKGILYLLAYNQFDRESYDEAIEIFNEILKTSPEEEQAFEGRIYAYFKKEEYETSKDLAEEALKKFPKNPRLHHILAGSYLFGFKNPEKAIELYKKAIRLDPNDVRIWLGYGESYFELKDNKARKKGIEILTECIRRFPDYHIAYIVLAEEYQYLGNYNKATELLEESINLDPAYYRAYSIIGDMLVSLGRYDEAMEYYQRTIKTNPVYEALIFIKVGELYRILGDNKNAEKYFRTALAVHKGNDEQNQEKAMAYLNLSRMASERREYKLAKDELERAFDSFPRYEYNHYYQALWYLDQKDYDNAEKSLKKCRTPETEESMDEYEIDFGRAEISSARGNQKEALGYLETAINRENDYAKVDIMNKAESNIYLIELRKTPGYKRLKERVGKIKQSLPPLKLNKNLLHRWGGENEKLK